MIKLFAVFVILCPLVGYGMPSIKMQMLDADIERLTKERDTKYEELKNCEKNTQGFKIAGLTTLVATGIGVYGNIKLYQKLNGSSASRGGRGGASGGPVIDNRSQEAKDEDSCETMCDLGMADGVCDCG